MKILLIDDSPDLRHLTKTALAKNGYAVAACRSAEEGIRHARQERPNLILMDVMMPGIGGAAAAMTLKADPQLKDIPVVFMTALITGREKDSEGIGVTIDGLNYQTLGKPYEIERLLEVVKAHAK